MPDAPRIPIRIRGTLRGSAVDADGTVRLVDDAVAIHIYEREHVLRVDRLDGVVWDPPVLAVHVARDVVELSGHAGLQSLGARITASALALPELARTMQGLGSRRGLPAGDHDRFFAGLLAARRAAEGFAEVESRLAAFDARRLNQSLTKLLSQMAEERYPTSPPDRRALEAELMDHAERLYEAIDALGEAAARVRDSASATRLATWRAWTRCAQRVFEEAGRCWVTVAPALAAAPASVQARRFWRRRYGAALVLATALHVLGSAGVGP